MKTKTIASLIVLITIAASMVLAQEAIRLEPQFKFPEPSMLVADSKISGLVQVLDGIHWRNVQFENATIIYNGGPVRMEIVSFTNCRLALGGSAAVTAQLLGIFGALREEPRFPQREPKIMVAEFPKR